MEHAPKIDRNSPTGYQYLSCGNCKAMRFLRLPTTNRAPMDSGWQVKVGNYGGDAKRSWKPQPECPE